MMVIPRPSQTMNATNNQKEFNLGEVPDAPNNHTKKASYRSLVFWFMVGIQSALTPLLCLRVMIVG